MPRQDNIIIWCLGVLNVTKTLFGHDKRNLHSVTFHKKKKDENNNDTLDCQKTYNCQGHFSKLNSPCKYVLKLICN